MADDKKYTIPYRSQLQEKFEPGQTLIIKGATIEESQRFTINFHCKQADFSGNDVPLHISFRFDEGKVVFNSFSKGEWGKEERKSIPIKKNEPFDVRVRAHDTKFQHWGGKYYPVPYESGLSNGFGVGKKLLIFGTPEKKARRFNINLLRKNGDIALHFNLRFDEKAVIRNALQAGEWGNEEREGKVPFEKGVGFDLVICNQPTQFHIIVNDVFFCNFAHRSDPTDVTGLQIQGDIELTGIQIQ